METTGAVKEITSSDMGKAFGKAADRYIAEEDRRVKSRRMQFKEDLLQVNNLYTSSDINNVVTSDGLTFTVSNAAMPTTTYNASALMTSL